MPADDELLRELDELDPRLAARLTREKVDRQRDEQAVAPLHDAISHLLALFVERLFELLPDSAKRDRPPARSPRVD